MIEFNKIYIEGFCSITSLEMPLNTQKITIVRGPNGYGKSNFLSAIVWALYGKNLKGISDVNTWKKFRTKDYMGTKVELYFKPGDGKIHKIIRCLEYKGEVEGSKGNNRLIYLIDAEPVKDKTKIQIQALIDKNLGMSYNLFINSIMFGQGMKRLIQESGSDKKNLFEEIFSLNYITKAKKIAQDKYSQLDKESFIIQSKLNSVIAIYHSQVESYKEEQDRARNAEKIYNQKRSSLKESKSLATKTYRDLTANYTDNEVETIDSETSRIKEKIHLANETLKNAKGVSGISLKELINQVIQLLEAKKYSTALSELKEIKESFGIITEKTQEIQKLNANLSLLYSKRDENRRLVSRIQKAKNEISFYKKQLRELKITNIDIDSIVKKYNSKMDESLVKKKALEAQLKKLTEEMDLYKWAYTDPFGNNGIKAFLFESSLGYLNQVLESYSEILGFNIQFKVDLNSTKKDFVTLIVKDGVDVIYEELSGGEKQLCNLAMAFAMNEVMTEAKGVNIAFLDEVFESLSSDNIEVVIGLIRKVYKNKTLFLITHQESLPIPNAKTLTVKKNHGLSEYEFQ